MTRALEREDRCASILSAATEVFAEKGYHAARVTEIAQRAGVADGTIYLYFPGKEDLLIAVFRDGIGTYLRHLHGRLDGIDSEEERLRVLVATHLSYLGSHPHFARVTQVELRQPVGKIRQAINEIMDPYFHLIDSISEEGRKRGTFRPELDRRLARRLIFGFLDECVTAWVMSAHPYDLGALAPQAADLLLGGLRRLGGEEGTGSPGQNGGEPV